MPYHLTTAILTSTRGDFRFSLLPRCANGFDNAGLTFPNSSILTEIIQTDLSLERTKLIAVGHKHQRSLVTPIRDEFE